MKKIVLTAAAVIAYSLSWAQYNTPWTNTISNAVASGYLGIGMRSTSTSTNNPAFNLHLHGTSDYTITVVNPFPQAPSMQNLGKTTRIGLTNTTTGMTEADGALIRMSDNNLIMENRELGEFQLIAGSNSLTFSAVNNRTWFGSNYSTAAECAKFNITGGTDNGLYVRTPAGKYGLSIRSGGLTDNAIQVMSADGTTKSFGVLANGAVAINSSQLAAPTTPVIAVGDGTTQTFAVLKNGTVQGFLNSTTLTDKVFSFSNPSQTLLQLTNDGILRARGMKVNATAWADYVFEKDYQLRSLDEVKVYINTNGHLPEVPSTAEVMENGVDVAQMNEILLKKVEELTLYLLQQDAKIKSLESSIEKLTNK